MPSFISAPLYLGYRIPFFFVLARFFSSEVVFEIAQCWSTQVMSINKSRKKMETKVFRTAPFPAANTPRLNLNNEKVQVRILEQLHPTFCSHDFAVQIPNGLESVHGRV